LAGGIDELRGKSNYFIGKNSGKWRRNVPTFAGVKFREIYPGIDLIYRGTEGRVEYEFAIAPGAAPDRIKLHIDGADKVSLAPNGDLIIKNADGYIVEKAPSIYQEDNEIAMGNYTDVNESFAQISGYLRHRNNCTNPQLLPRLFSRSTLALSSTVFRIRKSSDHSLKSEFHSLDCSDVSSLE
jgi:hypothetical protein